MLAQPQNDSSELNQLCCLVVVVALVILTLTQTYQQYHLSQREALKPWMERIQGYGAESLPSPILAPHLITADKENSFNLNSFNKFCNVFCSMFCLFLEL